MVVYTGWDIQSLETGAWKLTQSITDCDYHRKLH